MLNGQAATRRSGIVCHVRLPVDHLPPHTLKPTQQETGRTPRSDDNTPAIHLKGKWLNLAGFNTGTPLIIRVMRGCLVITTEPKHQTDNRKLLEEIQQTQKRICDITVKLNQ